MIPRTFRVPPIAAFLAALLLLSFTGCSKFPVTETKSLMGTEVSITVHAVDARLKGKLVYAAMDSAFREIERIEDLAKWNQMAKLNRYAGFKDYEVGEELIGLVNHAYDVALATDGTFRPDTGPLVNLWQIGTEDARIPSEDEIDRALEIMNSTVFTVVDSVHARLDPVGASLELGGIAKGYAVDRACEVLENLGVTAGMVWAGGDLRVFGTKPDGKPWRIAVRHPRKPSEFLAVIEIDSGSVATSGDYERYSILDGGRYCHIFDPRMGAPSRASVSATAVMPTCMDADAYATALFVLGPDDGATLAEIQEFPALVADERADTLYTRETVSFRQLRHDEPGK